MTTLAMILRKAYLDMGHMEVNTVTGGSTTTAIDTKLGDSVGDDDLVGRALFVIRDAGGAGAAPEGEATLITGYVESTQTMTLSPALSVALAAGDIVGIARNIVPLYTMVELADTALNDLGTIALVDTSLTTIADQTEYALPIALKYKINKVQVQTEATTGDNEYIDVPNWYVVPAAAGSTGLLVIPDYPAGYTLKLWYEAEHPRLSSMTDKVNEAVHIRLATLLLVNAAVEWNLRRTSGADPFLIQTANKVASDLEEARRRYAAPKKKQAKILTPSNFYRTDIQ